MLGLLSLSQHDDVHVVVQLASQVCLCVRDCVYACAWCVCVVVVVVVVCVCESER